MKKRLQTKLLLTNRIPWQRKTRDFGSRFSGSHRQVNSLTPCEPVVNSYELEKKKKNIRTLLISQPFSKYKTFSLQF